MAEGKSNGTQTKSLNVNLLAAHVGINAPHYKNSRFHNFPKEEEFENLFQAAVSHADHHETHLSALSPAAYFVDLVRLLEEHIRDNTLKVRRPDLWELPLDRKHTEELVPFLEIVNNVLSGHLGSRSKALERLASSHFPFDMPVNLPLLQIRTYLAHFGVGLTDVYETLGMHKTNDAWVAEALGLSPTELTPLKEPHADATKLATAYGLPNGSNPPAALADIAVFLKQTRLTPDDLAELLQVAGLALVQDKEGQGPVEPQRIENLDLPTLDYLNRFIRLRQRLGWTFSDLDWALQSICADDKKTVSSKVELFKNLNLSKLAQVKQFSEKYKLPVDVVCSFIHDMNTTAGVSVANKTATTSLFDRVFNTPPFYHPSGATPAAYHPAGRSYPESQTEALTWVSTAVDKKNQGIRTSLQASLQVGSDDLQAIVNHLCDQDMFDDKVRLNAVAVPLDVPTLTRLYRFGKMAQVLGMRVQAYLLLLKRIRGEGHHRLKAPEVTSLKDLQTVDYWADWLKEAGLSPYQLEYLTTGSLSAEARRDFDPGWTEEGLAALRSAVHATLEPWFIRPKSFAQGAISAEAATGVYEALQQAGLVESVADEPGELKALVQKQDSITYRQVIEALAEATDAAQSLVTLSANALEAQLRKGDASPDPESDAAEVVAFLKQEGILDKNSRVAAGSGKALCSNPPDLTVYPDVFALDDYSAGPELVEARRLLLRKAGAIRAITDTLNQARDHQTQATIKQLAETFDQDARLVVGATDWLESDLSPAWVIGSDFLNALARLLYLAKAFDLSAGEFDALATIFGDSIGKTISVDTLRDVHDFSQLVQTFEKHGSHEKQTAKKLAAYLRRPDGLALSELSGWEKGEAGTLQRHLAENVTWQLNENLTTKGVKALAATPDGGTLFAGTYGEGIFWCNATDDPSVPWTPLNENLTSKFVRALAVTPDGGTLFASTSGDLYPGGVFRRKVADEERGTWEPLNEQLPNINVNALAVTPDGGVLFAGTWGGGVFWRKVTDDASVPWQPLNEQLAGKVVNALAVTPDGGTLFAGTNDGGVFWRKVADDASVAWQPLNEQLANTTVMALAVTPDGGTLFAGTYEGGVFRRKVAGDASVAWQPLNEELTNLKVQALLVTPDGGMLLAGTEGGGVFWRKVTDEVSAPWQPLNENLANRDVWALAVTPDGGTLFAGTYGGGVFRRKVTDEVSVPWQPLNENLANKSVHALAVTPDGGTLFAGTQGGGVFGPAKSVSVFLEVSPRHASTASTGDDKFYVISPQVLEQEPYTRQRLKTYAVHELRQKLVTGGLGSLLSLEAQSTTEAPDVGESKPEDQLDFGLHNPYAIYFREIFFHIPWLIADALQRNQQFEHARRWYQHILDPTRQQDNAQPLGDEDGMWRYLPFRGHTLEKLEAILKDPAHQDELVKDAFDPHAIAQTRLGAYEKAVAMKYLDNLLDWGDMLFAQDSWEAINQAVILYVRALNLLGPKPQPQRVSLPPAEPAKTAQDLLQGKEWHTASPDLDDILPTADRSYKDPFFDVPTFFDLPENDEFAGYWDRVQDRLYKVRHCMNISGVVRQLALFQPPIDPRQLIRALAAGQDITGAVAQLTPAVPHYRFSVLIQQAKSLTATVIQLGSALLSALEKKDAEELNLLRSTQEQVILKMTRAIKDAQIQDGAKHLESLQHSLEAAQKRQEHYSDLIEDGYSPAEIANLALEALALYVQIGAAPLKGISIGGHLVPVIYGFSDGGMKPGDALMAAGQVAESVAAASQQGAGMAATIAQFQRRKEDWELQQALASYDVQQIQAEVDGAEIRQTILERELEIHEKSTEQAREREDFFRRKFSNRELYQWMAGRISTVYFQTYKLAFELARSAERAYQYERHTDQSFIDFGLWDSLRKGLLAGEGLMLSLNQLEKAHLDGNARELEIVKTISLLQLAPEQLLKLKRDGRCTFELKEQLFDYDFPGHYCRRIKSVSISIPAVVGPNQNVQATLIQTGDRVLLEADGKAVGALLTGSGLENYGPEVLRSNWRPNQQIAISRGIDDSGLFQLDFRDERYLPFEGTGALSTWELSLPKGANRNLDFTSISDVIVNLRYTALDGGEKLRGDVTGLDRIKKYSGHRLISLRQEFSSEWHRFARQLPEGAPENAEDKATSLTFRLLADRIALNCQEDTLVVPEKSQITVLAFWSKDHDGAGADSETQSLTLKRALLGKDLKPGKQLEVRSITLQHIPPVAPQVRLDSEPITFRGIFPCSSDSKLPEEWTITTEDRSKLAGLLDIVLVVPFEGDLDWG